MPIAELFDSQDAVPEEQRANAVQVGEKWLLYDVEQDPRVKPLKNAHERSKGEATQAKEALKRWADLGLSPDDITAQIEELATLKAGKGKSQEEIDARVKQVTEKWQGKLTEVEQEKGALVSQLDGLLIDDAATKAILAEKGNVALLLPHVKAQARVVVENGKRRAVVVDKDGNPRIADVLGTPMEFAGLVKEMKKDATYGIAFEGIAPAGSGARPSTPGGAPQAKKLSDLRTEAERSAFIKEHGFEGYKRLVDAEFAA